MTKNCSDELVDGKFIQNPKELLSRVDMFPEINRFMALFLENMEKDLG